MAASQLIAVRVAPETKARFRALATWQQMTESALLKRLVDISLQGANAVRADVPEPNARATRGVRLYVRLRPDDRVLLRERASRRGMAPATYVSVLTRSHLRSLPPLPREELLALKRSVAELGAVGRNLNQIARATNQGGRVSGPSRDDLRAILKVCEALRDHTKALINANTVSWETGHA